MPDSDAMMPYKLDHTMMRVTDLDRSLDFYVRIMGMKILRNTDYPEGRFTNVFLGFAAEDAHAALELTHNWDQTEPYDKGNGWGHIAIMVKDVTAACERMQNLGANVVRPAGPMKGGTRMLAFIEDPDGYKIELLEPLVNS